MVLVVVPVPVLSDNYAYLIIDTTNNIAAAVDPADAQAVMQTAEKEGVKIVAILTTHHHWDHAGGNEDLLELLGGGIPVYGGEDKIKALSNKVGDGDIIEFGDIKVQVKFTPCHTAGHVLYYLEHENDRYLFTGDTLFIGGCGRFFEGTAQQMVEAFKVIKQLPADTKIMCGHEYTVANLSFAQTVDPTNNVLKDKLEWAKKQREAGKFTIPSTVAEEESFNPFMRVHTSEIQHAVKLPNGSEVEVMAALRTLKNNS